MTSKGSYNKSFIKEYNTKGNNTKGNNQNLWKTIDNSKITLKDSKKDLYLESDIIVKGTIQNPSDLNLKTNIHNITNEETKLISDLHPVTYEYIGDENKRGHYGLIAQDVEEYYPNLVRNDLFYNYKSVNYIELIPLLISKIQHMEKEIECLKTKQNI
jgi:hypothetical protein|uniref:Peptidase S74 domain-containing protein n=1 Tax=viral metagenome TaxID=1070528 RepID=A0A6C0IMS8_9ZZZZ